MTAEEPDAVEAEQQAMFRPLMLARNAAGVRRLAEELGVPREELEAFVREELERQRQTESEDRLGPRYDISTGTYSTLEEWAARFLSGR